MRQRNVSEVVNIVFKESAFSQLYQWEKDDRRILDKLSKLIIDIARDPFHGLGKPEPLKENLSGYWSRRITDEHRIVYQVLNDQVVIISCKHHY